MQNIPTLLELYNSILADLEAEYTITFPIFGKLYLKGLAAVQAGKLKIIYLAIGFLQKNIFVDTATDEAAGGTLQRFGRVKLGRNPFPAVAGQYVLQVTGTVGAVIAASTTFKSNDDTQNPGKLFVVDLPFTLTSSPDYVDIRALESGIGSRLNDNDVLTATIPIAGVDAQAAVQSTFVEPLAAETLDDYRRKALLAYQLEANGGAGTDYRLWSLDAQGVEQVYPYAKSGAANEIEVFVEATIADSTDGKGTPTDSILMDVESVIEFDPDATKPLNERGRRPLGVFDVHVLPITVKEVDIIIDGFIGLTAEIEATILAAMEESINLIRPFVASADILADKNNILDTNKIIAVILNARPGSVFGTITLNIDSVAFTTYTFYNGDIPHLNTITYT